MENKHTPGPWKTVGDGHTVHTTVKSKKQRTFGWGSGENNTFICDLNDHEYHEYVNAREQAANARLIAAAPELLGVLTEITEKAYLWDKLPNDLREKAGRAIAKAEGRE